MAENFGYILKFYKENNIELINAIRDKNCIIDFKNDKITNEV